MLTAAIVLGAGLLVELCVVIAAPFGYQDERGFHFGMKHPGDGSHRQESSPT
jgi:hypothetical protein